MRRFSAGESIGVSVVWDTDLRQMILKTVITGEWM